MQMQCAHCNVLFDRDRRRGAMKDRTTYCSHACFAKNVVRLSECLTCAGPFKRERYIAGIARKKYCSDLCESLKNQPLPPLEIYGDESDRQFILCYRRKKLLNHQAVE